jgi:hypothetical protein
VGCGCADLNGVILKLKRKMKMRAKLQLAERRARNRKEHAFLIFYCCM